MAMPASRGASIVEFLVAITIAALVAGATLSITLTSREFYGRDRGRVELNQNLNVGLDLLGIDLRATGEGLPFDFPAVEIVDGASGSPDELILRRSLHSAVLPLCAQIDAATAVGEIRIASSTGMPSAGCLPLPDRDSDGWPDNLGEWRARRLLAGGTLAIYVFNPATRVGEFVVYDDDGSTTEFIAASSDSAWQNSYPVDEQCRIYLLEEHRYRSNGGMLEYLVNGDTDAPVALIDGLVDFQARAVLSDGSVLDAFDSGDRWSDLLAVEIELRGESEAEGAMVGKTVVTRYLPRHTMGL